MSDPTNSSNGPQDIHLRDACLAFPFSCFVQFLFMALLCYNIWYNKIREDVMRATVTKIGNSTGVILPKAAVERLKVKQGDVVYLTETPTGYTVTPYDPEFAEQMEAARQGMNEYRNALHELAK
jgi:putative addiction module antidote